MNREFVRTSPFERACQRMGLTEEDIRHLEETLLADPQIGDVIPGINGARKMRIQTSSHGKRGGGRVIYIDLVVKERIHLLFAYPKNELANLTAEHKKMLNDMIKILKGE